MGVFAADGKLQTGWSSSETDDIPAVAAQLAAHLGKPGGGTLCNPAGRDLTKQILSMLEKAAELKITDILIQADPKTGAYQAILVGRVIDSSFYIEYLCSVYPRAGVALIDKVKAKVRDSGTLTSITLEPVKEVIAYYESQGFTLLEDEDFMMEWKPSAGGKRKRRTRRKKLRKTTRKHKQ